jgi:hypothetical protein
LTSMCNWCQKVKMWNAIKLKASGQYLTIIIYFPKTTIHKLLGERRTPTRLADNRFPIDCNRLINQSTHNRLAFFPLFSNRLEQKKFFF